MLLYLNYQKQLTKREKTMKKILIAFCMCFLFCACSNGYSRAIKNYTGPTYLEETTSCDVKITYDFDELKYSRTYLTQKKYDELGYSCWTAKPGWNQKHAEKLCKKLGGDLIVLYKGEVNSYSYDMSYTTYDTQYAHYNGNVNSSYNTNYYASGYGYVGSSYTNGYSNYSGTVSYTTPTQHNFTVHDYTQNYCAIIYRDLR